MTLKEYLGSRSLLDSDYSFNLVSYDPLDFNSRIRLKGKPYSEQDQGQLPQPPIPESVPMNCRTSLQLQLLWHPSCFRNSAETVPTRASTKPRTSNPEMSCQLSYSYFLVPTTSRYYRSFQHW